MKSNHMNWRELRKSAIVGRCVTKTTFNVEQRKLWMTEDYKRNEFFRTEFIDEFDAESQLRFNNFNTNASHFYDQIEIGRVYAVDTFEIMNSNKVYNALPNKYEASFTSSTKIMQLFDDGRYPTHFIFSFTEIQDILKITESKCIELQGIVRNFTEKRWETN